MDDYPSLLEMIVAIALSLSSLASIVVTIPIIIFIFIFLGLRDEGKCLFICEWYYFAGEKEEENINISQESEIGKA